VSRGVKPGSSLEKEVFRAMKEDSGFDIRKPGTFAHVTDAAKIARITAAYVKEEVRERQETARPKKVDTTSSLDKVRLRDGSPSVGSQDKKVMTYEETFEALRNGKQIS
jgi:hypothetical protein